jgi:aryl-alcohol dehydrogenase-like predicted oxidoreductase
MHHVDRDTPWEEIWQAFEVLVQQGKVLYVGSSNFAGWQLAHAQGVASARHFLGLVSEQSLYNLAERTVELEVIPAAKALGIGIIPWSPLARGALAGGSSSGRRGSELTRNFVEKHRNRIERYERFSAELGENPADLALAWLLHNPAVTAPIIGPRTLEQLDGSLRALEIKLTPEILTALDDIWPGPGGEAPEAYAW